MISFLLVAYLLGSVPFSYILGKLIKKLDIRQHGSGNVGATNALRVLGTKYGVLALILDALKGAAPILIARALFPEISDLFLILVGLFAILGHIFTIFLRFKGGKGVATSAGVFAALIPTAVVFALFVFVITVAISRYVSLGSILAAITLLIVSLIRNIQLGFTELELLIFVALIVIFIIFKHRSNIKRLINGNENKISFKK
jgi:glycerol-3-phosphate acyltransferase PlsY